MENRVKEIVCSLGADVCGIAGVERFLDAPAGFAPRDLFPACKSVVVFGVALPEGLLQIDPRLVYAHYNAESCARADGISFRAAGALENEFACVALPLPSDGPYEFWDAERLHGQGLLSMKHAAVAAGLGSLGKNTLLLSPRFGNRLTIGAVLTDMELDSDAFSDSICIPGCNRCEAQCPVNAICGGVVEQKLCREHAYGHTARGFAAVNCNRCRTACPMKYGK